MAGILQEVAMKISGRRGFIRAFPYVNLPEEHITAISPAFPSTTPTSVDSVRKRLVSA